MLDQLLDYLNIKELYPPQKEAMQAIERNESLLMSVPTAAGKTVVAYNALMKAVKEGKKGIFLVPLRALAWEKVNELRDICKNILNGAKIGVSVGDFDKIRGLSKYDIIVATSERADSLIRHNPSWLTEVGCLVSDEIHLINDSNRGPTLEVTLSKFREINPDIQIIGLSATVSNSNGAGIVSLLSIYKHYFNRREVLIQSNTMYGVKTMVFSSGCKLGGYIKCRIETLMPSLNDVYEIIEGKNNGKNINAKIGVLDISYKIKPKKTLRLELQYLAVNKNEKYYQDKGNWTMGMLEYTISPKWFFALSNQYNGGYTDVDGEHDAVHYLNFSCGYTKKANRFVLGYGKQREGIFCAGGVCRRVPSSNGLTLTITSSF